MFRQRVGRGFGGRGPTRNAWLAVLACSVLIGCEKGPRQCQPQSIAGVVVGDSMAPNYLGRHLGHQCPTCEYQYVSSADPLGQSPSGAAVKVICPNCGQRRSIDLAGAERLAETVSINSTKKLNRFDVVAFRRAGEIDAGIKRVIGLPGEKIVFRDGNAFAVDSAGSDSMLVKTLEQQRDLRIPVFDGSLQLVEDRWSKIELSNLIGDLESEIQWRQFVPKRCYDHRPGQPWKAAIEDNCGFNQTVDRKLNTTSEVFLQFDVEPRSGEEVWIRFPAGGEYGRLRIRFEKGISRSLFENETDQSQQAVIFQQFVGKEFETRENLNVEFSNFDGQVLLAIDGELLFQEPWPVGSQHQSGGTVAVGQTRGLDPVGRIRLWRDVFWFAKLSEAEQLERQKNQGRGYFLVGDNVPVSVDSRHWDPPFVPRQNILGGVKKRTGQ